VELGQVLHVEQKLTGPSEPGNGARLLGVDTKRLDASQLQELDTLVNDFRDTFSTGRHDLGRTDLTYHQIDTGDASPIKQPPRRLPIHRRQEVGRLVNEMEKEGVI